MQRRPRRRWQIQRPLAIVAATVPLLAGCVSYERRAIDIPGHHAAFLARSLAGAPSTAGEHEPLSLDDGCSLREAEAIALLFRPELRVARAALGVADARLDGAGHWDDPVLEADIARILANAIEPWEFANSIRFTLPISGRLDAERERLGAEREAELLRVQASEWNTRLDVRSAFASFVSDARRQSELADDVARVDATVRIVDRMEASGEMSRLQARLFRIELETRRDALRSAEAQARTSELALRSLLGAPPGLALAFDRTLPSAERRPADALRAIPPSEWPAVAAANAEYEVAERALALAVREQYPDLTVGPGYGREGGDDRLLLGLSLPLPILGARQAAVAVREAERTRAGELLRAQIERTTLDLEVAMERWSAARDRAARFRTELAPLVEAQLEDAKRVADLGEIDALVLLETLSRRADVRLAQIEAERDEAIAAIAIDRLVGPRSTP